MPSQICFYLNQFFNFEQQYTTVAFIYRPLSINFLLIFYNFMANRNKTFQILFVWSLCLQIHNQTYRSTRAQMLKLNKRLQCKFYLRHHKPLQRENTWQSKHVLKIKPLIICSFDQNVKALT